MKVRSCQRALSIQRWEGHQHHRGRTEQHSSSAAGTCWIFFFSAQDQRQNVDGFGATADARQQSLRHVLHMQFANLDQSPFFSYFWAFPSGQKQSLLMWTSSGLGLCVYTYWLSRICDLLSSLIAAECLYCSVLMGCRMGLDDPHAWPVNTINRSNIINQHSSFTNTGSSCCRLGPTTVSVLSLYAGAK